MQRRSVNTFPRHRINTQQLWNNGSSVLCAVRDDSIQRGSTGKVSQSVRQSCETVKYDDESRGTRNKELLCFTRQTVSRRSKLVVSSQS
jgi:hypothetical protein